MKVFVAVHLALLLAGSAKAELTPRMLAELAPKGRRLSHDIPVVTSQQAFFIEHCTPTTSVAFPLSAGEGKGMIGLMDNTNAVLTLMSSADIELEEEKVPDVFGPINDNKQDGTVAQRFTYDDVPDGGAVATVSCTEPVELLIAYKDRTEHSLEYRVTRTPGTGGVAVAATISLPGEQAKKPLKGKAFSKRQNDGQRKPNPSNRVRVHDETKSGLEFDSDEEEADSVVVQVEAETDSGKTVYRSIVVAARKAPPKPSTLQLDSASINTDGDLDLQFSGIPQDHVLLKALVSIWLQGKTLGDQIQLSAMVDDGKLVLHEGWIQNALSGTKAQNTNNWKVVVHDAVAQDPDNGYVNVAELGREKIFRVTGNRRLNLVAADWKPGVITDEMKMGRRSEKVHKLRGSRNLQGTHKKILVHGYCATSSPWPIGEFTNAVEFADAAGSPSTRRLGGTAGDNNWSHDLFARKIDFFADAENIVGCGTIAHSQGGAASLHLYTWYTDSCLHDADQGGSRLIQTVGTPFQGTALAGGLAALGAIFGIGCDENYDLSEEGAAVWLATIPTWARAQVHYYTTSFEDKWWRWDYCHFGTDPFLSDPDDGTISKSKGQLSGANNRGHKTKYCHTTGMRDPAQYYDSGRNSDMNNNAKY